MQGSIEAVNQPGMRELLGDRTELRISVWASPTTVTVDQVAKWTWQQHGQLWKVCRLLPQRPSSVHRHDRTFGHTEVCV